MTADITPKPLRVAIVGGGPGGLGSAIALSKISNVRVTVYEQASVLHEVGAGISVGPNSWKVLELLGAADAVDSGHQTWTTLNLCVGVHLNDAAKEADSKKQQRSIWRRAAPP